MKTKPVYYDKPYRKELKAKVLSVQPNGKLHNIILDQTIFYPEGGGQPSDKGYLDEVKVKYVRISNGEIIHQTIGEFCPNQVIEARINWKLRYKYMRIHTAGHLLHDILMSIVKGLVPLRGSHGKKPFLEYKGSINLSADIIQKNVNSILQQNLPVATGMASYDKLKKECKFLPTNLPQNKPLRIIRIGDYPPMPDGGVHVWNTKEIGTIWIANIIRDTNKTIIRYGVTNE